MACHIHSKVDILELNTTMLWTPILEIRCGSRNWYEEDMYTKEIGLHAQDMLRCHMIGGGGGGRLYDSLVRMIIFSLVLSEISKYKPQK